MYYDIIKTLRFEYHEGAVTSVSEGTTWRLYPYWVIVHTTGSEGTLEFDDRTIQLPSGTVAILPAHVQHKFTLPPGSRAVSRWCHVNFPILHGLDISLFLREPVVVYQADDPNAVNAIREIIERMVEIQTSGLKNEFNSALTLQQLGIELLGIIASKSKRCDRYCLSLLADRRLMTVLEFIDNNLAQTITREHLAQQAGLSVSRFNDIFTKIMKIGPMELVRQSRISKACDLLRQTSKSISCIAGEVGYGDQFVFSRTFKARIGLSPLKFRNSTTNHTTP